MADKFNPKNYIRTVPDWPVPGVQFRDITTLIEHPLAFRQAIDQFVYEFQDKRIDAVVGIDARGFIFGAPLAYQLNVGFIPVRKKGKLPFESISVSYDLEYGSAEIEINVDALKSGQRVLLVDDLIATGGTMLASLKLIEKLGAEVVSACALVDLPDLNGSRLIKDAGVPVFSLCEYEGD